MKTPEEIKKAVSLKKSDASESIFHGSLGG